MSKENESLNKIYLHKMMVFVVFFLLFSLNLRASIIAQEQAEKFLQAVWKEKPQCFDVMVYKHTYHPVQPEEVIRQRFQTYIDAISANENMDHETTQKRADMLKELIQRALTEQKRREHKPERESIKSRVQIDGLNMREDMSFEPDTGRPDGSTLVRTQAQRSSHHITHSTKTVLQTIRPMRHAISSDSDRSNAERVREFSAILNSFQIYLGTYRESEISQFVPDPEKITLFRRTGILGDGSSLAISEHTEKPDQTVCIKIVVDGMIQVMAVTDVNDYSKVYELISYHRLTGAPLLHQKFSDYGDNGYPYRAEVSEYDWNGVLVKQEIFEFKTVDLAPEISPDTFEFVVPQDYIVIDVSDPEQYREAFKARAVSELKGLLTHSNWGARLYALQNLSNLLKDNPEEIKKIAEEMKNDPNPHIQKVASDILTQKQKKEN